MKKLFIQIPIFILLTAPLNASSGYMLKAALNYSTLRNSDADFKRGYTFGIGKDWNIIKNVTIGSEIDYTTRGGLFNDKPIKSALYFSPPYDVYSCDIHVSVGYIEMAFHFKYSLPIENLIHIQLYAGPAVSLPIIDYSNTKDMKFLFYYDPNDPDKDKKIKDIEYYWMQDSGFYSKFNLDYVYNFGFCLNWSKIMIELRYTRANKEIGYVDMVSQVHKKSHVVHLLLGFRIG